MVTHHNRTYANDIAITTVSTVFCAPYNLRVLKISSNGYSLVVFIKFRNRSFTNLVSVPKMRREYFKRNGFDNIV